VRTQVARRLETARATVEAKWLQPEKYHLPLVFLGNATAAQVAQFEPLLQTLVTRHQPFRLHLWCEPCSADNEASHASWASARPSRVVPPASCSSSAVRYRLRRTSTCWCPRECGRSRAASWRCRRLTRARWRPCCTGRPPRLGHPPATHLRRRRLPLRLWWPPQSAGHRHQPTHRRRGVGQPRPPPSAHTTSARSGTSPALAGPLTDPLLGTARSRSQPSPGSAHVYPRLLLAHPLRLLSTRFTEALPAGPWLIHLADGPVPRFLWLSWTWCG
jgi:hypothetical protein